MAQALEQEKEKEKEEIQKIIDDNKIDPKVEIDIPINPPTEKSVATGTLKNTKDEIVATENEGIKSDNLVLDNEKISTDEDKVLAGNTSISKNEVKNVRKDLADDRVSDSISRDIALVESESNKKMVRSKSEISDEKGNRLAISSFQLAMNEFNNKNYSKAINLFVKVKEDKTNVDELNYYLGQSYQYTNNQSKAIICYDKVIALPMSKFYESALWNKSQIQIKSGKKNDAVKNLNVLLSNKGKFSNQAKQQIDSLNIKK
jgi:tetratricopeptide (TPR) repeat protein